MDKVQAFLSAPVTFKYLIIILVITLLFIWQYNKHFYDKHAPSRKRADDSAPATGTAGSSDTTTYDNGTTTGTIVDGSS